jgi:hypothetical protein
MPGHARRLTAPFLLIALFAMCFAACGGGSGGGAAGNSQPSEGLAVTQFALVNKQLTPIGGVDLQNTPRNALLKFTFTQDVAEDSVNERTIRIGVPSQQNLFIDHDGAFTVDGNVVYFDPSVTRMGEPNPLAFRSEEDYQILVRGDPEVKTVKTLSGRSLLWAFETAFRTTEDYLKDYDQPMAVQISPDKDEVDVDSRADVVVKFSEPMKPETFVLGDTFKIYDAAKSLYVFGTLRFSQDALTATFRPTFGYGRNPAAIEVTLSPSLTDLAGNPLGNPQSWTFTSAEDPNAVDSNLLTEDFTTNTYEDTAFSPPGAAGVAHWNPSYDPGRLVSTFGTNSTTVPNPLGPMTSGNCIPMGSGASWNDYFCQLWYNSSVLGGLAGTISGYRYFLYSGSAGLTPSFTGITLKIGHSKTKSCPFVSGNTRDMHFAGTPVTCISDASMTVPSVSVGTPISFPAFTKAFGYDGSSSLVVDIQKKTGAGSNTYWSIYSISNGARAYGTPSTATTVTVATNYLYQCVLDFRTELSGAQSLFYKTDFPAYFLEPVISPTSQPSGTETVLEWQGAGDPTNEQTFSSWTADLTDLDTYQYIRLRVAFTANLATNVGPKLEEIIVPYTSAPAK